MGKQELLRTAVVWRVGEATRSGIPVYREAMGSAKIAPHKVAAESRENLDRTGCYRKLRVFSRERLGNGTRGGNVCRGVQTYYALKDAFQRTKTLR